MLPASKFQRFMGGFNPRPPVKAGGALPYISQLHRSFNPRPPVKAGGANPAERVANEIIVSIRARR